MKKIKMKKIMASPTVTKNVGDIFIADDKLADELIESNSAELIENIIDIYFEEVEDVDKVEEVDKADYVNQLEVEEVEKIVDENVTTSTKVTIKQTPKKKRR